MNIPTSKRRTRRRGGQIVLVAVITAATVGILVLVGLNAALLGRMTTDFTSAQRRATNLANTQRETSRLLLEVTRYGDGTDSSELAVQRGLLARQLDVSSASFQATDRQAQELGQIKRGIGLFPWDRLGGPGETTRTTRLAGIALLSQSERLVKSLYEEQEHYFYTATIESLDAKQRSETGTAILVSLVLVLGTAGGISLRRRTRSDVAQAYDALRASEGRFRSLVQRASDLTVVTEADGTVTYVSPAAEALLGYRPEELLHRPLLEQVEPGERSAVGAALGMLAEKPGMLRTIELRLRTRDGRIRLVEAVCQNLVNDPDVRGVVWNGRDVTERRALEDELSHQAHHDPLTGLPNRVLLLKRLESALGDIALSDGCVSVILVDLDGFKNVNDTLGHSAGDELLQRAAERLRGCVLAGDTAARLGGDEFAIVIASRLPEHAISVSRRIVDALRQPITVAGHDVSVSASVGVAHREGTESAEDLLRDADIAMYVAKNTGKGHHEIFERDMRTRASQRTSLQQHLARAVDLGEIEVHYQPIIDLPTNTATGLEALARWRHPERSMVPPDVFIPIAEESGSIVGIGREVLRQACTAVQQWRSSLPGQGDLDVAVNVSVHQVLSGQLVDHVAEALGESGLAPSSLTLEITESMLLEDSERVAAEFARLKRLGVKIAVDDFGSGYSSLGFLLSLDADVLKIDRTLLDFDTTRRGSMVQAISELGRTLGLTVIVEGVETPEHLERAREALCDAAQGYHFARPLPPADVPGFFADELEAISRRVVTAMAGPGTSN